MTNLTEQWKKGELEGEYYIETTNGEIYNVEFQNSIGVKKKKLLKVKSFKGYVHKKTVNEVLAPVPSYEEWKSAQEQLHKEGVWYTEISYKKVLRENKQLKERNDSLNNRDINLCRIANGIRDENFALKSLLKECRFILREMSDVNNWLESDDCVLNYDMATECEKYATKIDQVLGEE